MDVFNGKLGKEGKDWRSVTVGERVMLLDVFGIHLNIQPIKIYHTDPENPSRTHTHADKNNVYLLGGDYANDLSTGIATARHKYAFIHEVTHVWQYQKTGFKSGRGELDYKLQSEMAKRKLALGSIRTSEELLAVVKEYAKRHGVIVGLDYWEIQSEEDKLKRDKHNAVIALLLSEIGEDKRAYIEQECYDPIYKGKSGINFVNYSWLRNEPEIEKEMSAITEPPKIGERMSAYMWRVGTSAFKNAARSEMRLKAIMKTWATSKSVNGTETMDYNYMLSGGGGNKFFDLRYEAQAQLIGEYYLIKNSIDPRTIVDSNRVNFTPRPPLKFYQDMLKGILH